MIDIEEYNFEKVRTDCDKCPISAECNDNLPFMVGFESKVDIKFEENSIIPACWRFKITKKIKDENTDN